MQNVKTLRQIICLGLFVATLIAVPPKVYAVDEQEKTAKSLAHYTMGLICDLYGMTEESVKYYESASGFDPGSYVIRLKLGANYARLGNLDVAVEQLKAVHKYNPQDLQSHYLLALIYSTQKNYDLAAKEYEFILKTFSKSEPENIEIYGYLGQLYYSQKRYKLAIEQFEKILSIEPKNAEIMYLLGSLYLEVDDKKKAIELFLHSIQIDPGHDGSLNSLGYVYAEKGEKLDEAKELVERAIEIDPENGAYLDSLGWIYYKKGDYQAALKYLMEADQFMQDPVIYEHIGDVYYQLQEFENARKYWEQSLDLAPEQQTVTQKIKSLSQ